MKMTSSKNSLSDIKKVNNSVYTNEDDEKIYSRNDLNNHLNDIKNVLRDKERGKILLL